MKRLLILAVSACFITSCTGWDSEHKELFHKGCMEDAKSRMDEAAAKSMCDCRLEKAMKKYPDVADAFEHIDSLINDPEIQACK